MKRALPVLAVSIGCPSGVGPEVSVVAAAGIQGTRVVLVGDVGVIARAATLRQLDVARFVPIQHASDVHSLARGVIGVLQPTAPLSTRNARPGHPSIAGGAAQLAWIDTACDVVSRGEASALVTGPVSKAAIARSGSREAARFLGHTEHLQRRLHAGEVIMAFACETFTTSLVTTHLPLARVPRAITPAAVASATFWLADLLAGLGPDAAIPGRSKPRPRPTVAVVSLNPHAGEGGLLGGEEARAIIPGITLARERLRAARIACDVVGPVPAETAFRVAAKGKIAGARGYDGVVAMYHDQATIAMKLVGFGEAVNVSLALPIVRTSVDHGTAYDIAGRGIADARGMALAMSLGVRLASRQTASRSCSTRAPTSGAASRTPRTPRQKGTTRTRSS